MIKKYIFLLCMLFTVGSGCTKKKMPLQAQTSSQKTKTLPQSSQNNKAVEELVDTLYGKNGANLDLEKIFTIQDLINSINKLSKKEEQQVACATAQLLQKDIKNKSELIQCLHTYLINYFQKMYLQSDSPQYFAAPILGMAHKIIDYINLEQEDIFTNQKSKHIFAKAVQNYQLPDLINFWSNEQGQKIIDNYNPLDPVKTQWMAQMAAELTIAIIASSGASLANSMIGAQTQMLSEKINKNSQVIQSNMQSFQKQAQSDQQKKLQSLITVFSNTQKDIQKNMGNASTLLNLELDYLYKNISVEQPQQNFIFSQVQYDQLFSLGTMHTPQGAIWKNPFAVGDWEYDASTNSFWQYKISPIFIETIDEETGEKTKSSLQAENNAIFTEYYTKEQEYVIAGSITLTHIEYPFFAGIMFNKARWISGDFESVRKCRMIGFYGTSSSDLGIYFAEQYTMNEEQLKATNSDSPIQTPLQQILNKMVPKSILLPAKAFDTIDKEPITINFEIINSATTVSCSFWKDQEALISRTFKNLNPDIFMYHGIGFICPSAIARFSLKEPYDLIFSKKAIANYKD